MSDQTDQEDAIQRTQGWAARAALAEQVRELRERLAAAERAIERLEQKAFFGING